MKVVLSSELVVLERLGPPRQLGLHDRNLMIVKSTFMPLPAGYIILNLLQQQVEGILLYLVEEHWRCSRRGTQWADVAVVLANHSPDDYYVPDSEVRLLLLHNLHLLHHHPCLNAADLWPDHPLLPPHDATLLGLGSHSGARLPDAQDRV